jgi:hypothetical protein
MERLSRSCRTASRLAESVHQRFSGIAIATVLAVFLFSAFPAQSKVVYVPVDVTISGNGSIAIPVNNGIVEFTIQAVAETDICGVFTKAQEAYVNVTPATGNGVVAVAEYASALNSGAEIDSTQNFYEAQALMAGESFQHGPPPCEIDHYVGYWCDGSDGRPCSSVDDYLGLEFEFKGSTYYGWAHLTVTPSTEPVQFAVELKGFAYETIAGKGIKAGQKSGD